MDHIEFVSLVYPENDREAGVRIFVDGRDLVELVRAVEEPFVREEDGAAVAGSYRGLPLDGDTRPPSRHFLGEPDSPAYRYGEKTQILMCECGEVGCWPLVCRIEVSPTRVRWSEFEQPLRSGGGGEPAWRYDQLGPFEFERVQYEKSLAALDDVG